MVELNESMNTTPCYDLIAAFGITALIRNDYTSLFDENGVFKHYQNSDVVYQLLMSNDKLTNYKKINLNYFCAIIYNIEL